VGSHKEIECIGPERGLARRFVIEICNNEATSKQIFGILICDRIYFGDIANNEV
jgi:hypothetical protein